MFDITLKCKVGFRSKYVLVFLDIFVERMY